MCDVCRREVLSTIKKTNCNRSTWCSCETTLRTSLLSRLIKCKIYNGVVHIINKLSCSLQPTTSKRKHCYHKAHKEKKRVAARKINNNHNNKGNRMELYWMCGIVGAQPNTISHIENQNSSSHNVFLGKNEEKAIEKYPRADSVQTYSIQCSTYDRRWQWVLSWIRCMPLLAEIKLQNHYDFHWSVD